jgi:hypothetical protein
LTPIRLVKFEFDLAGERTNLKLAFA